MKTSVAPKSIAPKSKVLILLLICLSLVTAGRSQTAGNWNFNGILTGTPGSFITASGMSLGSSIISGTYNVSTEYYGQDGWPAGALDPNAYLQFTLTGNAGYYLVLNSISLVQRRSTTGTAAGSGPTQWSLRSSLDNYTTDIASGSLTNSYITYTVTLPAAFQSIPSSVTFRVYGYNAVVSSGGSNRFVYDNISVQGQAVPGTLAQQSIDLTAQSAGPGKIALQWGTDGFAAGTEFTLQRSTDGVHFTSIFRSSTATDNQPSGTGNNSAATFQYGDASAAATIFYRVTAGLPDGTDYLSSVVAITQSAAAPMQIKGVATMGTSIRTFFHIEETGTYQLSIWSSDGAVLLRQIVQETAGDPVAELSLGSHPHGAYILTLSKDGQNSSRQFVY